VIVNAFSYLAAAHITGAANCGNPIILPRAWAPGVSTAMAALMLAAADFG